MGRSASRRAAPQLHQASVLSFGCVGPGRGFVADPFVLGDTPAGVRVIFEVLEGDERSGQSTKYIGAADLTHDVEGGAPRWSYIGPVIREMGLRFAFPFAFEHEGVRYAVPDVTDDDGGSVPLRVYAESDAGWSLYRILDVAGSDPVVFRHGEAWWLCVGKVGDRFGGVRLYRSDTPFGPWDRAGQRPLSDRAPLTRMAGRPLVGERTVWLPFQVRRKGQPYGSALRYVALDMSGPTPRLRRWRRGTLLTGPGDDAWCADGIHHVDFADQGRLLVIDGRRSDRDDEWRIGAVRFTRDARDWLRGGPLGV